MRTRSRLDCTVRHATQVRRGTCLRRPARLLIQPLPQEFVPFIIDVLVSLAHPASDDHIQFLVVD